MNFQILDISSTKIASDLFNLTAHIEGRPYWLPYVESYFDDIGIELKIQPLKMLDLSKPWILCLPPNAWNWNTFEGDFLDVFESDVRNELVYGKGYLVINHEAEALTHTFYKSMHRLLDNSRINPNKVIYLVGAINPQTEYNRFVKEYNIPKNRQIKKIISSLHVFRRLYPSLLDILRVDNTTEKHKKFLSLNRNPRTHRIMMISLLAYYDLLDFGYVSLGAYSENAEQVLHELNNIFLSEEYEIEVMDKVLEGFEKIRQSLPLKIDDVDLRINQVELNSLPNMFYERTYFSVVSSTFALKTQEFGLGFTEKEIKPILFKHPFLLHSLPGALKHLKNMGFLSFDRWFDESYDEESNDIIRMNKLLLEIKRLSSVPDHQWNKMLVEMEPVLLHNYNILCKHNKEHVFFHSDLKEFVHYVS